MNDVPFRTVYVHALVRDEKGQKMSKSKGNVIDPLTLIDEWGADALRLTLTALSSPGRDIKLSTERVKGYRNFVTKLWNAARFCQLMLVGSAGAKINSPTVAPSHPQHPINRDIMEQLAYAIGRCEQHLADYRFDYYASELHQLIWHQFCDWYVEWAKPLLQNRAHPNHDETKETLLFALRQLLIMAHPVMPFVTEQLYQQFFAVTRNDFLSSQSWPLWHKDRQNKSPKDNSNIKTMAEVKSLIANIRSLRVSLGLGEKMLMRISGDVLAGLTAEQQVELLSLGYVVYKAEDVTQSKLITGEKPIAIATNAGQVFYLLLPKDFDRAGIKDRLGKELQRVAKDISVTRQKTDNKEFTARAKPELVADMLARLAELEASEGLLRRVEQSLFG